VRKSPYKFTRQRNKANYRKPAGKRAKRPDKIRRRVPFLLRARNNRGKAPYNLQMGLWNIRQKGHTCKRSGGNRNRKAHFPQQLFKAARTVARKRVLRVGRLKKQILLQPRGRKNFISRRVLQAGKRIKRIYHTYQASHAARKRISQQNPSNRRTRR